MSFAVSPIFMTRLVEDSGCSMMGMPADCGRSAIASARRSWTSCRAFRTSVPILKISRIADRPVVDWERMTSRLGVPRSVSSIGAVMSSSTSIAVMPMPSVWISTSGGANSGNTSTGILRSSLAPKATMIAAAATMRKRNFKLEPMIQLNILRACLYAIGRGGNSYLPWLSAP
jgi:hypothetical protein